MRRLLIIGGIVLGLLVVTAVALPLFINVDTFRPELEKRISASLNRQVHIGKLEASLFSGGASASNITIADDSAFSRDPFLKADTVKVGLHLMPLIFSKRMEVTSITVQNPEIVLLRNAAGKWNYSSLGSSPAKGAAPKTTSEGAELSIDKVEIVDGRVKIGQSSGHSAARERTYDNVRLVARNIAPGSVMPFTLKASTPGGGALKMEGTAGPLDAQDSARTPFDTQIKIEHADLGATGFLDPESGIGGTLDLEGKAKSDGRHLHSEGKAKASGLKAVKGGAPANAPVAIDYKSDYNLTSDGGNGSLHANIQTRNSTAVADGTVNSHGADSIAHLKLKGKDMAVNDVSGLLPAFGVVMPSGASLEGGVLNMDLNAEGPLDRLVITGPLNVSGTHLSGYNLGSKLGPLASLSGIRTGNDTLIQTMSSGLRVAPDGLRADNIVLELPEIGTFTGQGVVGSDNSLDFQMLLKLSSKSGGLLGNLGGFTKVAQSDGIAFLIKGKTSNPVFMPAMAGGLKSGLQNALLPTNQNQQNGQQQQQQGVKGLLNDILNGNKKKQ